MDEKAKIFELELKIALLTQKLITMHNAIGIAHEVTHSVLDDLKIEHEKEFH